MSFPGREYGDAAPVYEHFREWEDIVDFEVLSVITSSEAASAAAAR